MASRWIFELRRFRVTLAAGSAVLDMLATWSRHSGSGTPVSLVIPRIFGCPHLSLGRAVFVVASFVLTATAAIPLRADGEAWSFGGAWGFSTEVAAMAYGAGEFCGSCPAECNGGPSLGGFYGNLPGYHVTCYTSPAVGVWISPSYGTCDSATNPDCARTVPGRFIDRNAGVPETCGGNPCNLATGDKFQQEIDYAGSGPFPLRFVRSYNSAPVAGGATPSPLGPRWTHNYHRGLAIFDPAIPPDPSFVPTATLFYGDGKSVTFQRDGDVWLAPPDVVGTLTRDGTDWLFTADDDRVDRFDSSGRLTSVTNRAGLTQTLTYTNGYLVSVSDHFGRSLIFTYDSRGRLATMTDPAGGLFRYFYGEPFTRLETVSYPDATPTDTSDDPRRVYLYNEAPRINGGAACPLRPSGLPYHLTGIIDENNTRFASWTFDCAGRALSSEHAGGVERIDLSYDGAGNTTATDAFSQSRAYFFTNFHGVGKNSGISGAPAPEAGPAGQTFDTNGNVASRTDWNGNVTTYQYDLARNLELSRTEASGTPEARTITTEWHANFRLPTRITEPGRETVMDYDVAGNMVTLSVRDSSTGETRTVTYTYDASGQVLSADGPRTDVSDVITYAYYANDDPDPGKRGNLRAVVNARGHRTEILNYDAHGQPLDIVDPNGLTITLMYDARQRLTSRSVGGETTRYAYDGVGQLTRITLPDGSALFYAYDGAHRLTGIADHLGNRIDYRLDSLGNRTKEDVHDASGALAQTQSREYSSLNRLTKDIGAYGQATSYGYDFQGNLTSITDPLGRLSTQRYDARNRLVAMTDPASGNTRMDYDAVDQLLSVTDPRTLQTVYTRSGLGDLLFEQSPDAGTTARTFDAAGNVATQVNANGTTATFAYDVLDRVTQVAYSDGQTETFTYDQGANGLGRLTRMSDSSGTTAYGYDANGRVTQETRTIGGQTYVTAYSYDAAGRLASTTYPSGRVLTYTRDGLGRVAQIDTSGNDLTQVLVQGVSHFPFGGVKGFTTGSLAGYTRSIDQDGRITAYSRADGNRTLVYDEASRITAIRDPGNAANDSLYGYDALGRLTGWTQGTTTQAFAYDASGNRASLVVGGTSYPYTVDGASNRLNGVAGPTPSSNAYDASGNLLSSATGSFTHDARLRLVRAAIGSTVTVYQLNALGQRVAKLGGSGGTHYHYDAAGRLIAESDAAGNVQKEYVWLGETPVAMIDSTAPPAASCPSTPQLRPPGGFTPYERRERMEVHSGQPGQRGWEWGLGTNTRDFDASAREDVNWVSGKPYSFRLVYDGVGNARVDVRDDDGALFTLTWTGDMNVGNALRFVVRSQEGAGAGNRIQVSIASVDGQPVNETLATAGDNSFSRDARIIAGESLKDGYTVEGTVTFIVAGAYPPRGSQLEFLVTAGNVTCEDAAGGGVTPAQAKVYYIHPDHLDTPRVLTDEANRIVWRWDSDPFGAYLADEDPDEDGAKVTLNLRFPGQYFDKESNLHYNYFRDYDPQTGRYIQIDPIGLDGGINSFTYVAANPLSFTDSIGLQPAPPRGGPMPRPGADPISAAYARSLINRIKQYEPQFTYETVRSLGTTYGRSDTQYLARVLRDLRDSGYCPAGGTYVLRDPLTGQVMRCGRTNCFVRREGEHKRDPILGQYRFEVDVRTDSYAQQRGREQIIHEMYEPPLNRVNPISPRNRQRDSYLESAQGIE